MKEKSEKTAFLKERSKGRTHSPKPRSSERKSAANFSVSPTVKEFQEMKIGCEDDQKNDNSKEQKESSDKKSAHNVPIVVPIRKGRKGSKWQASGFITKLGDQILSYTAESGVTYRKGDTVYLENPRDDQPFYVCAVKEFRLTKKDTLVVTIKWYFRSSEVPDSVYLLLVQDRHTENRTGRESALHDPKIKSRELFISNASDTYPVKALKGKCKVEHFQDIYSAKNFKPRDDTFFYVLEYNPKTKRLATTQGEIRVGPSHQARLPVYRQDVSPSQMPEKPEDREELRWRPQTVMDGDLMMYLRAARSVAAFAGMCHGGSTEDGCQAASMDETTINAMDTLHRCNYDTGKALQALVKCPALRSIEKKWSEDDLKRFNKGLKTYGKNFFKIRKELLPNKDTGELIEYYYFWKKTPAAASNRPHRRHRRVPFKRNTRSQRPPSASDCLDLTSASESEDSDDSGGSRDLNRYTCRHCFTTVSKDWHHAGKDKSLRCTDCRLFFKRHGEERPLDSPDDPPFLFKPVKEETESLDGRHNMRTRQSRETGKGNKKKESNSSPDIVDSPFSGSQKNSCPKSPSTNSTCSNSSTDRDSKKLSKEGESEIKGKKRQANSDTEDKTSKKKKPEDRSDSEFVSDSSSLSGNDEEIGNDVDTENNQDDLSSSSQPSTPRSVDADFKTTAKPVLVTTTTVNNTVANYENADIKNVIVRPEPVIATSSPSQSPPISKVTTPPPITQHLPSHRPPLSLPLKAFPLSSEAITAVPASFTHPVLHPVYSSVTSLSSPSFSSSSLQKSEQQPHSPRLSGERSESLAALSTQQKISFSQEPIKQPLSDLKFSPHSSFSQYTKTTTTIPEQKSLLSASTCITPVYPATVTSSQVTDFSLSNIKQEPKSPVSTEEGSKFPSEQDFASNLANNKPLRDFEVSKVKTELVIPVTTHGLDRSISEISVTTPTTAASSSSSLLLKEVKVTENSSMPHLGISNSVPPDGSKFDGAPIKAEEGDKMEMEENEDSDLERGTPSPGPTPEPCSIEAHRSKTAILMRILDRGPNNKCSRCDIIFKPPTDPKLTQKRPAPQPQRQQTPVKIEEKVPKKPETPPPNSSADAQVTSNVIAGTPHHFERHTPRSYPDTPALRQLSEYAKKPHSLGSEPGMSHPGYGPHLPGMDPLLSYRMAAMYPPGSRERLELELERDKRERDAREREIREREIREMEMREKLKHELEMKPPGLDRLLPHGPNPLDPQWLELQRRYGYPPSGPLVPTGPGGPPSGSHIPGVYPPTSLASDLMQRERERLERLGIPQSPHYLPGSELMHPGPAVAERLSAERLHAERMALSTDPMVRLHMASLGLSAAGQSHTHTHAHSHTHLHLHQPDAPPGLPPFHPLGLPPQSPLIPPFAPGADPLAAGMSGANPAVSGSGPHLPSLPHGLPSHAALLSSREQEMLQSDLYRRAYADPNLAQQLSAQAAQHEALQRQLAMDRERFGPGHLPPH